MDQDIKKLPRKQPLSSPPSNTSHNHKPRKKMYLVLVLVIALMSLLIIGFLLIQKRNNRADIVAENVKALISKHMLLPTDEEPAYATITDKEKLDTPFLKQAENGDKLLIYQNNQKVIIYRPSIDRIIDVGPVTIADSPQK